MNSLQHLPSYAPLDLYELLGSQVKSYHRFYHMGENTSVPAEIAQELLDSIHYTLLLAGEGGKIREAMNRGQAILEEKLTRANQLFGLVEATWDGGNLHRWEAQQQIKTFLQQYDYRHFAHRIPQWVSYPLGIPMPEGAMGVDWVHAYLTGLWMENQILDSFPPGALEELENAMPPDYWAAPENMCQQPLCNGLGRRLLGLSLESLLLSSRQKEAISLCLSPERVMEAMDDLCEILQLSSQAKAYAKQEICAALPRLWSANAAGNPGGFFAG